MPNPNSIYSVCTNPTPIPFKDYYTNWFETLNNTLLPLLHQSLSLPSCPNLLSSHLHLLLHHLLSYYDTLDLSATTSAAANLPHLLHPSWRTPIEKPFLFLGDLHPYAFTNLLRSLLEQGNSEEDEKSLNLYLYDGRHRPWEVVMAWKDPSKNLTLKIEQIECGLRLMVPALLDRVKKAQAGFVGRIAEAWVSCVGRKERAVEVGEAMKVELEELMSVFVDANRMRKSLISDIVGTLNLYQGALFLEALAQFLVGFKDPHLHRQFLYIYITPSKLIK